MTGLDQRIGRTATRARIVRNLGWLAGAKGLGALLSIVYLGLAARALGPAGFGYFAMVLAYAQATANFIQFQSWQFVIRFGARHLEEERGDRFEALIGFALWLDIAGALASALLASAGAGLVGRLLGWPPDIVVAAQFFGLSLAGWARATPTGILRLLDRFDQLGRAEMLIPVVRLTGAPFGFAVAPTAGTFLLAWAVSEIGATILVWRYAARALAAEGAAIRPHWPRGLLADNPHLWRFALSSNAAASVNLVWQQLGTLAVGGALGAAVAGNFRLAFQIAQGLAKPALLLGRVAYPEFSRSGSRDDVARMVRRSSIAASGAGLLLILFAALFGGPLLALLAGPGYSAAAPLLLILIVAVAIDLAAFAFEPALLAAARAGAALAGRAAGALVYAALLLALIGPFGAFGAAWAAVAGASVAAIFSFALLRRAGIWTAREPAAR